MAPPERDLIYRGNYAPSLSGTLTFVGLRAVDPALQYSLLAHAFPNLLTKCSITPVASSTVALLSLATPLIDGSNLYIPHSILCTLSGLQVVKHIWWKTCVSKEHFPVSNAFFVSIYNSAINCLNSLLFTIPATSSLTQGGLNIKCPITGLPINMVIGTALFLAGLGLEACSEYQRKIFKDKPENKGKVCRTGLWAKARQPNYGGYTLWRMGYAVAASGWVAGLLIGGLHLADFKYRAIPAMDKYCGDKYGEQWVKFKADVKYELIPGVL